MKVSYYGHSCVEFDFDGIKVLVDPFISYNDKASHIDIDNIKPDYIFLSHGHEDHVADMKKIHDQSGATVCAIVETAAWVRDQGVADDKVIEFNLGGTLDLPFWQVKMVYAAHTNSTPDGRYGGHAAGFVFFVDNKKIYFAGDTSLTMEMKLLTDLKLDYAFLPLGGHYTMDVHDALRAAQILHVNNVVGIHYNTFPPIAIDKQDAKHKFANQDVSLLLLDIGEEISL